MCVSVAIRIQVSCRIGRPRSLGPAAAPFPPRRPYPGAVAAGGRTYQIRTYGCQMNAHDSERLAGLLDEAGYQAAGDGETPDVVVFNTCAVRENAADRLYGNLGHLLPQKKNGMQIAVGGCLAQMERTRITERAPWVDVVLRHAQHGLAARAARAGPGQARSAGRVRRDAGDLPLAAARPAPIRLLGLGRDLGGLQQHLHLLHRACLARQGKGPPPRRHPGRDPRARRRRGARGHLCSARM